MITWDKSGCCQHSAVDVSQEHFIFFKQFIPRLDQTPDIQDRKFTGTHDKLIKVSLLNSFKYMKHFFQNCEMLVIILPTTDYEDRMYAPRLTEDMKRLLQMMRLKTISAGRVCRCWPIRSRSWPMRGRASQAKDVKYEDVKEWHSEICNYAHCLFCEPRPVIIMTTR